MDVKNACFFLKQRIRPGVLSHYRRLLENQYLSPDALSALSWDKRMKLLSHAYHTVPYYSKTLRAAGIHPEDIRNESDWERLPLLTKEDIRNNFESLRSDGTPSRTLHPSTTGGSTGQPLTVLHDSRYPVETLGWRVLSWWGARPGDDAAFCWRLLRRTVPKILANALLWWPTRRIWLDASALSEKSIRRFLDRFNALRPVYLQGYTGSIHHVAQYILDHRLAVRRPCFVWGTSSPVSGTQRACIEQAFSAPLYNQYGCCEVYWLAAECRAHRGLHVFTDARHLELLDEYGKPSEKGKMGRVTITDLENYGFPLIRYQNGDLARAMPGECSCGVLLPRIFPVLGRVTDLVHLPGGGAISGDYATTLFDDFPGAVSAFQLRQHADYSITISMVAGMDPVRLNEARNRIERDFRLKSGNRVTIRFKMVNEIENDCGKTRYIISEVIRNH